MRVFISSKDMLSHNQYIYKFIYIYIYIYIYMCVCVCVCVYIYVCVCVCVCVQYNTIKRYYPQTHFAAFVIKI